MIRLSHLQTLIIRPAIEPLGLWSEDAEALLLGTAAQESHLGYYLKQLRGPARGIYQMEPATERDIWENWLGYNPELVEALGVLYNIVGPNPDRLVYDLQYASIMARFHYRRVPEPLPSREDIPGMSRYWKRYYNTLKGKGTPREFAQNYTKYVLREDNNNVL